MVTKHTMRGYALVALAACLWGSIGLFTRALHDTYGLSALPLAFLRAGIASVIAFAVSWVFKPDLLRLTRRSAILLLLYGFVGITLFYFVYAQAIISAGVTTAVVLLYTAPVFVTLIAWRAWREPLSLGKGVSIALAFVGCALVARVFDLTAQSLNLPGILFGLGAGLTYALFTVFSKSGLRRFSPWTLMVYELLFGALFLLPLQTPDAFTVLTREAGPWLLLLGLAIGPTLVSIVSFSLGLRDLPASNASIVATIEPVVASALAFLLLGERLEPLQLVGGAMVIGGALSLSLVRS